MNLLNKLTIKNLKLNYPALVFRWTYAINTCINFYDIHVRFEFDPIIKNIHVTKSTIFILE